MSSWCFRTAAVLAFWLLQCMPAAEASKPVDWDKLLEKGYHQLAVANNREAAEIFATKVKKYPQSGACHTALGRAYKKLGKISECKTEFRSATETEPSFADGWYELGAVLESDHDYSGAANAFERYLQLKPDSANRRTVEDRIRFCKNQK